MSSTLRSVVGALPEGLAGPEALDRLIATSDMLPAALSRWIYFEARLRGESTRVDLVIEVDEVGRAILSALDGPVDSRAGAWRPNIDGRLRAFCRDWGDPTGPLRDRVKNIWLEFDLAGGVGGDVGAPITASVFVCFGRNGLEAGSVSEWLDLIDYVTYRLTGTMLSAGTRASLGRCYLELPVGGRIPYVGLMRQRRTPHSRLCVTGVGDGDSVDYLGRIGWPGPQKQLDSLLADLRRTRGAEATARASMLHLDVGDDVQPRVGFEYLFHRRSQLRHRLMETEFLDHLVGAGHCTAEKRRAVANWPGGMVVELPHELWRSVVLRRVNHVKLVFDPDTGIEFKVYLSAALAALNGAGVAKLHRTLVEA